MGQPGRELQRELGRLRDGLPCACYLLRYVDLVLALPGLGGHRYAPVFLPHATRLQEVLHPVVLGHLAQQVPVLGRYLRSRDDVPAALHPRYQRLRLQAHRYQLGMGHRLIEAFLWFCGAEFYKWIKRIVLHRQAMKAGTEGFEDLEDRVFSRYYTDSSSDVGNEKQNEKV